MCLLNIPDVMREFGPIQNYWEGGMFGEKILKFAKGTWYGFTDNWASNMIKNIIDAFSMKRTVFDLVLDGNNGPNECQDQENEGGYDRMFHHIYKSAEQVRRLMTTGIPVAIDILYNTIIIATKEKEFISDRVEISDPFVTVLGHNYFNISLIRSPKIELFKEKEKCYGLLLPLYNVHNDSIDKWTIITSEWEDLTCDREFASPQVIDCIYPTRSEDSLPFESTTSVDASVSALDSSIK